MVDDVFGIVGSVIAGVYHVERVVAEGGFAVVYRAHHGGFRAPVALKLLKVPAQDPAQQVEFLALFRAEAELLFRLSASLPTVVRPLHVDAFTAPDGRFVPYLVLEWLEGLTLDALIKQRNREGLAGVPLRKLVRLLTPVARALERAHHFVGPEGPVSVVHRDLKPENIFVAQVAGEEVVKILDFGISKVKSVASQVAGRMSQDGSAPIAFTPAYGAPEQWAPRHYGQTGPWTDVWGLALCMVEVMAGRPLIEGDPATMMGITLDPKRRPTPQNEGIELPSAVEAVFARALALDPRKRQADAGVFWDELTHSLELASAERGEALPRDPRSEAGGGVRVERVEQRARPSGSLPRVAQPRSSAPVEPAFALDLEFDPLVASQPSPRGPSSESRVPAGAGTPSASPSNAGPARVALSDPHFVPDLELTPPSIVRRPSGTQAVAEQPATPVGMLDLDETPGFGGALKFDLDLPPDEPLSRRSVSSQRLVAVQPKANRPSNPPRTLSGSHAAVREQFTGNGPNSGVMKTRISSPELSTSGADSARPARVASPLPQAARRSNPPPTTDSRSELDVSFVSKVDLTRPEERSLFQRLRFAIGLFGAALLVAVLDPIYAVATGEILQVIGVRLSVFAGGLLAVALVLAIRELARHGGN